MKHLKIQKGKKMLREMLIGKIHGAVVTGVDINYKGSITIDETLMRKAGMLPYELVHVLNINNGARVQTYIIKGEKDSGEIFLNGAIARMAQVGDKVLILSYGRVEEKEAENIKPKIVLVDENNHIKKR